METKKEPIINFSAIKGVPGTFKANENSSRIASWKKERYGMFIHWGLYSAIGGIWNGRPATKGYSEQIQMWQDIPETEYLEIAENFTAENFNPQEIVALAKQAGMKYIVITTKHHDGFCMFDTATTSYNIVEKTPYGKDPIKLLSEECERQGLKFGVYYSLIDWYMGHNYDTGNNNPIPLNIEEIIEKQLTELMTNYGSIFEVWFDMGAPTLEQSQKFIDIVRKYQPDAAINSRIWNNLGDFRTLDDNEIPSVPIDGAWQTPASIYNETWGYRKWQIRTDLSDKVKELLSGLMGGGNYLLNIGPRGDGSVVEFEKDVLNQMGQWVNRHPEAAMDSVDMQFDHQTWGKVRVLDNILYLILMEEPEEKKIGINGLLTDVQQVVEDGTENKVEWSKEDGNLIIQLPDTFEESFLPVIKIKLEKQARFLPKKTILVDQDLKQIIKTDDLYYVYGYSDSGSYQTARQTLVRYRAYILPSQQGKFMIELTGEADSSKDYRVTLGEESYLLAGKELNTSEVGPFNLTKDVVLPLVIELENPEHTGEEIGLDLDSISLWQENYEY